MKRLTLIMSTVFILVPFLSPIPLPALAAPIILKFSSPYDLPNAVNITPTWFVNEFEKRTGGRYKVEKYFGGTLGKFPDIPGLCANGVIDFTTSGVGYNPSIFKLTRGLELMYVSENPYAQQAAVWDMYHNYAPFRDEWEKNGLILGYVSVASNMIVVSKIPLNTVEDIKGFKARGYAGVVKMIQKFGGIPVALAMPEVYEALNRGVIKGAFGAPYFNAHVLRHWEVAPYIVDIGVGVYCLMYFGMSKKTYDGFPPDVKKIVDQLREDANFYHRKWLESYEKEVTEKIINEKTIKLIRWTQEEKDKAKKMVVPFIWEDWLKEAKETNLPGEEFLDTYKKLLRKYEAQYPYLSPYDYYLSVKKDK